MVEKKKKRIPEELSEPIIEFKELSEEKETRIEKDDESGVV